MSTDAVGTVIVARIIPMPSTVRGRDRGSTARPDVGCDVVACMNIDRSQLVLDLRSKNDVLI
jgi:hypothetical protein